MSPILEVSELGSSPDPWAYSGGGQRGQFLRAKAPPPDFQKRYKKEERKMGEKGEKRGNPSGIITEKQTDLWIA